MSGPERDGVTIESLQRTVRDQADTIATLSAEIETMRQALSHDLRAPLRAISGFSALLREEGGEALPAQWTGYLEHIHGAARRMSEQIEALLRLSGVSRRALVPIRVDLSALVRGIVAEFAQRERSRVVALRVADGIYGEGDVQLLRTLLEALLDNAWRCTADVDDACIEFGVNITGAGAHEYFVRDNGIGFDMAHASELFAPFRRLHARREHGGCGIGLALAQRIVQRHGGRIRADARSGGGALFAFTLAPARRRDTGDGR